MSNEQTCWQDRLSVEFVLGDIFLLEAEALACPLHVRLEPYGKISQKLFTLGGSSLAEKTQQLRSSLLNHEMALGEAVAMDVSWDAMPFEHIILTALWADESAYTSNLFYKAYLSAIRAALNLHLSSIALPVFAYDSHLRIAGEAFIKVVRDLNGLANSGEFSIDAIYLVSTKSTDINYLIEKVEPELYRA